MTLELRDSSVKLSKCIRSFSVDGQLRWPATLFIMVLGSAAASASDVRWYDEQGFDGERYAQNYSREDYWAGSSQSQYRTQTQQSNTSTPRWRNVDSVSDTSTTSQSTYGSPRFRNQGDQVPLQQQPQFRPNGNEQLPDSQVFQGHVFKDYGEPLPEFRPMNEENNTANRPKRSSTASGEKPADLPNSAAGYSYGSTYGYGAQPATRYPGTGYPNTGYPGLGYPGTGYYPGTAGLPYNGGNYDSLPFFPGGGDWTPGNIGWPGSGNNGPSNYNWTMPFW